MKCTSQFTLYNTFIGFFFSVVFILSLLGNLAVIFAISKHQRSLTNAFLLNLAIADLLRSMICIPPTLMTQISRCWLLGPLVCKFAAYLQPVTVCASAYTLAVIALERYFAICHPLESRSWLSKRRSLELILFVWVIAFVGNVGALVIYNAVPYKTHWSCRSTATPLADFLYQIHVTLLLLLIPLTVMLCLYCKIIKTLHSDSQPEPEPTSGGVYDCLECSQNLTDHRSSLVSWLYSSFTDQNSKAAALSCDEQVNDLKRKEAQPGVPCGSQVCNHDGRSRSVASSASAFKAVLSGKMNSSYDCGYMLRSNRQEKIIEAKKRVTRMLIIIVIAFVICWTPSFIWWLVIRASDLVGIQLWNSSVNTFITLLTYISTCTNPITYCFMNERFRRNIFACSSCCPFQMCKRSLQPKSSSNAYPSHRLTFMDRYNGGLFSRGASNMEQAVAVTPLMSEDGL